MLKPDVRLVSVCCLVVVSVIHVSSLNNGLARSPPMGWMTWERFRCNIDCKDDPDNCISENLIQAMADRIVEDGYREAGYEYVAIDDCWMSKERDPYGRLVPDPDRFPSGIKALADYVHSKGLKLGIYEDFGKETCGGYPGSEFFMKQDANTFAEWGVDMLKFDGCNSDTGDMSVGYPLMGFFLNKTGRPILYSCSWPAYIGSGPKTNYTAIAEHCNMWRNYRDIEDSWEIMYDIIQFYGKNPDNFSSYAGPGNWNDPDQLIVGDFSLSYTQQKAQMGMWAIMASPLFMSSDLRHMPSESMELLQNKRLLAINQDKMGIQGTLQFKIGPVLVWKKPISNGGNAIAFLNGDEHGTPQRLKTTLMNIGLFNTSGYQLTEAFEGTPMGFFLQNDTLKLTVDVNGIFLFTAFPKGTKIIHQR